MPVHTRMACGDQKVCIIGEIRKYVASMLRARKFNGSPHGPRRIADPQNVEGRLSGVLDGIEFVNDGSIPKPQRLTTKIGLGLNVSCRERKGSRRSQFPLVSIRKERKRPKENRIYLSRIPRMF